MILKLGFKKKFVSKNVFFIVVFISSIIYSNNIVAQANILISAGGTVSVSTGDKFYDAGGALGNDGNTSYTITLCPAIAGQKVALDFTYFKTNFTGGAEDALFIYDGATATGNDIGKLMGDYSIKTNSGTTPYGVGRGTTNGAGPDVFRPTIFAATNASGCLTLKFVNTNATQYPGWVADIYTYTPAQTPGCTIDIISDSISICNGNTTNLTVTGAVVSSALNNNFNASIGTGWASTAAATITPVVCLAPSLDGSSYLWMQNAGYPRSLESNAMDVSNGGSISFEYRQAKFNSDASPCEAPDILMSGTTNEGVYVQYSTNGGATWVTFKYLFSNSLYSNSGTADAYNNGCGDYVTRWTKMTYPIPVGAQSATTKFRWIQPAGTSASTDNWGLDNVIVASPKPITISIKNLTTNLVIGTSTTSPYTLAVSPTTTTTYEATITDGVTLCADLVTVTVNNCVSCSITAVTGTPSACNPATNTYTANVVVTYSNAPASGTLNVNGQTFAITSSPQTVTLTGLVANGSAVNLTAVFSASAACTFTQNNAFTAPVACNPCSITAVTGTPSACNPATNTYTASIVVTYANPPASGTLNVNGQTFAITTSPQTITLVGLAANGLSVNLTAVFSATAPCTFTKNNAFTAPVACNPCNSNAGTISK